jgi:RNA polymerase sigma-70 factor (ECF subfamily)
MQHPMFDQERGSLRQYLHGILRNLVRQHLRASGREVNWDDNAEDELHFTIPAAPASMASAELSAAVQTALSALPPLQREAIVLCEFEELSLHQAAAIVGVDIGALKARLHRAREGLRRRLAPYRSYARVSATKRE